MSIADVILIVVGFVFNIGVVATFRSKAAEKGRTFLASGGIAPIVVFILFALELLVTGSFGALDNATAFTELLKNAATLTATATGGVALFKGIAK